MDAEGVSIRAGRAPRERAARRLQRLQVRPADRGRRPPKTISSSSRSGFRVFVDPFSAQYLNGVTIDYVSSMQGSGFTFKNPNATGGCGCGSSFTA